MLLSFSIVEMVSTEKQPGGAPGGFSKDILNKQEVKNYDPTVFIKWDVDLISHTRNANLRLSRMEYITFQNRGTNSVTSIKGFHLLFYLIDSLG